MDDAEKAAVQKHLEQLVADFDDESAKIFFRCSGAFDRAEIEYIFHVCETPRSHAIKFYDGLMKRGNTWKPLLKYLRQNRQNHLADLLENELRNISARASRPQSARRGIPENMEDPWGGSSSSNMGGVYDGNAPQRDDVASATPAMPPFQPETVEPPQISPVCDCNPPLRCNVVSATPAIPPSQPQMAEPPQIANITHGAEACVAPVTNDGYVDGPEQIVKLRSYLIGKHNEGYGVHRFMSQNPAFTGLSITDLCVPLPLHKEGAHEEVKSDVAIPDGAHGLLQFMSGNKDPQAVVIRAHPLQGKSTFLRRFAYDWAAAHERAMKDETAAEGDDLWTRIRLLFFVELKNWPQRPHSDILDFVLSVCARDIAKRSGTRKADRLHVNDVKEWIKAHGAATCVLLDGLDEVPEGSCCEELTSILTNSAFDVQPCTQLVITTRFDCDKRFRPRERLPHFRLGEPNVEELVDKYCNAKKATDEKRKALLDRCLAKKNRFLLTSPLFLHFYCWRFLVGRHDELPASQTEMLTEMALSCFAEQRSASVNSHDLLALNDEGTGIVCELSALAFETTFYKSGLHFDRAVCDSTGKRVMSKKNFKMATRSGIIVEEQSLSKHDAVRYRFWHRTFQQFFAANHLVFLLVRDCCASPATDGGVEFLRAKFGRVPVYLEYEVLCFAAGIVRLRYASSPSLADFTKRIVADIASFLLGQRLLNGVRWLDALDTLLKAVSEVRVRTDCGVEYGVGALQSWAAENAQTLNDYAVQVLEYCPFWTPQQCGQLQETVGGFATAGVHMLFSTKLGEHHFLWAIGESHSNLGRVIRIGEINARLCTATSRDLPHFIANAPTLKVIATASALSAVCSSWSAHFDAAAIKVVRRESVLRGAEVVETGHTDLAAVDCLLRFNSVEQLVLHDGLSASETRSALRTVECALTKAPRQEHYFIKELRVYEASLASCAPTNAVTEGGTSDVEEQLSAGRKMHVGTLWASSTMKSPALMTCLLERVARIDKLRLTLKIQGASALATLAKIVKAQAGSLRISTVHCSLYLTQRGGIAGDSDACPWTSLAELLQHAQVDYVIVEFMRRLFWGAEDDSPLFCGISVNEKLPTWDEAKLIATRDLIESVQKSVWVNAKRTVTISGLLDTRLDDKVVKGREELAKNLKRLTLF